MLHIASDKLQSTLGLKLPPVFTFLPCLASCLGLLPGGQGGRHALQRHNGPNILAIKYKTIVGDKLGEK